MPHDADTHPYVLPGGKASVTSRRKQLRASTRGAWLFGPAYLRTLLAARYGSRRQMHTATRSWARHATRALELTIETHGTHRIEPDQQYVVAPLHEGFADVLALSRLPLDMAYSAAEELFAWRFLGPYLRASGQSPVSIDNGVGSYRRMLRSARAAFGRNESYVVFPQGSILGIEVAFHEGAFTLAAQTGRPLLPVVLTGGASVWDHPYSSQLNFGQKIRLEVLDPIDSTEVIHCAREIEIEMKERALAATPTPRRFDPDRDGWWDGYRYEIDPAFPDLARRVADHRGLLLTSESEAF
ncbi:MAG: lysophospholipid acyltransferase family protein [Actinomycetota bacterium]